MTFSISGPVAVDGGPAVTPGRNVTGQAAYAELLPEAWAEAGIHASQLIIGAQIVEGDDEKDPDVLAGVLWDLHTKRETFRHQAHRPGVERPAGWPVRPRRNPLSCGPHHTDTGGTMHVSDILTAKASQGVVTIGPDAGVRELLALMAEHNVGALIVSTDGDRLDGIVSERDVVRHLHADGTVVNNTVGAIMTAVVETCESGTELDEVMKTMTDRHIRHVPVVENGALRGIISIGDVVKHKIGQLTFERDQLEGYVNQT